MKSPTLLKTDSLSLSEIEVGHRLRPVSEAAVESLMASITELGVMKDAIHVRKRKDGRFGLIAGAHRLEAALRLGWEAVPCKVWAEVTDDWALLMEVDDNIAGAELGPLDTAVFLAQRKAIFERLHPETRRGVAGALARWDDATDTMSVASFVRATADKFCMSERQVFRLLAAGSRLTPIERERLRQAPRQVTLKDLGELSRHGISHARTAIIDGLASGSAKSASAALRQWKASEAGEAPAVEDRVEAGFIALSKLWSRVPKAARRRFVAAHSEDLALLAQEAARGAVK